MRATTSNQALGAAVVATLAVDRFCDLITYALLFVTAAFALPLPPQLARWRTPGLVAVGAIAVIAGVLIWQSGRRRTEVQTESPGVLSFGARARRYWRRLVLTSASVTTSGRLASAILLSFIAWAGQWATYHYAAHAVAFATTPAESLLALLVVNASFVVRVTPGNVGVFQLLYALAVTSTGLDRDSAVAAAFLIQLVQYIPVTIIGLLIAPSLAAGKPDSSRAVVR